MAKTANERLNERVQQMLGAQQVQIAQLLAEIEVLREENYALKTPPGPSPKPEEQP